MSKIVKVEFNKLKRLKDLTIDFPEVGVVALMGENGIGKSTVLHALACLYRPHEHLQVKKFDEGSWWTAWSQWLVQKGDGRKVKARVPAHDAELGAAPGQYVMVRYGD